jgi:hypothetical protein
MALEGGVKFLAIDMIFSMPKIHSKFFVHELWTPNGTGTMKCKCICIILRFTTIMCNTPNWSFNF